jgi:hypothetical protein
VGSVVIAERADARFGAITNPATTAAKPKFKRFIALLHVCGTQRVRSFRSPFENAGVQVGVPRKQR